MYWFFLSTFCLKLEFIEHVHWASIHCFVDIKTLECYSKNFNFYYQLLLFFLITLNNTNANKLTFVRKVVNNNWTFKVYYITRFLKMLIIFRRPYSSCYIFTVLNVTAFHCSNNHLLFSVLRNVVRLERRNAQTGRIFYYIILFCDLYCVNQVIFIAFQARMHIIY